jgi:Domain of unknown function (DUF222)/HNH endonuclease
MCSSSEDGGAGGLSAALDALAADELFGASDQLLLDRLCELVAARNRLEAELARTAHRAEAAQAAERDGLKNTRSWLRSHTRLPDVVAKRLVDCGRAAAQLPQVAAAFAAGVVTGEQVAAIAPITTPTNLAKAADAGIDLDEIEQTLLQVATTAPHDQLRAAVDHYLDRLDPDGPEPDPTEARSLSMGRTTGCWHGTFTLDEVGGEKVAAALESIAAASRIAGDGRSHAQRHGDALIQLADLALASGQLPVARTVKPHLIVSIGIDDLVDPATGPGAASTGMGETISAARARWGACDASVTRIVLDPDGQPLDVGRAPAPPQGPAASVRVVGGGGVLLFAGCEAPHWWCEVHHLIEWAHGGQTSLENSALLCERHHTKVHHGFRVERDDTATGPPGRRWRTYRPDGTEIILGTPLIPAA